MLAYEIWIDGERVCLAGLDDWSVLSAHVTAVRRRREPPPEDVRQELEFAVGGLSETDADGAQHHVRWQKHKLTIGSEVRIRLVEADRADEPVHRYRSGGGVEESPYTEEEIEQFEREELLRLKAKYEPAP